MAQTAESNNRQELLFFGDKASVYKSRASEFADTKASVLGDYIPTKLGFEDGEITRYMAVTDDYAGYMLFFFENGKMAKVEMSAYATKTNRRRLVGAYSDKVPLVAMMYIREDTEFLLESTSGRRLVVNTAAIAPKSSRTTIGVQVMTLKGTHRVKSVQVFDEAAVAKANRYRTKSLPAAGALPAAEDFGEQLTLE